MRAAAGSRDGSDDLGDGDDIEEKEEEEEWVYDDDDEEDGEGVARVELVEEDYEACAVCHEEGHILMCD